MDEQPFQHLRREDLDVCHCYHYNNQGEFPAAQIAEYSTVWLAAWSMGIWVANQLLYSLSIKPDISLAISGSPYTIHDHWGIPEKIFAATLDHFSEKSRNKFYLRMCGGQKNYKQFCRQKPLRSWQDQQEELQYLRDSHNPSEVKPFHWDYGLFGLEDKIFPVENLKNFWREKAVIMDQWTHVPFLYMQSWHDLFHSLGLEYSG